MQAKSFSLGAQEYLLEAVAVRFVAWKGED